MKKLIVTLTITAITACAFAKSAYAANYSTEATITRQKDKGIYLVEVYIWRLVERNGKTEEELISHPRLQSSPGVPATLSSRIPHTKGEQVNVDVLWPASGKEDFAVCTIIVKEGDKVVLKNKTRVSVDEK